MRDSGFGNPNLFLSHFQQALAMYLKPEEIDQLHHAVEAISTDVPTEVLESSDVTELLRAYGDSAKYLGVFLAIFRRRLAYMEFDCEREIARTKPAVLKSLRQSITRPTKDDITHALLSEADGGYVRFQQNIIELKSVVGMLEYLCKIAERRDNILVQISKLVRE